MKNRTCYLSLTLLALLAGSATAAVTRIETFDTGVGNFTATQNLGTGLGGDVLWSPTNNTAFTGADPGGEMSAPLYRETGFRYRADGNLGGNLTRSDTIILTFEFYISATNNYNGDLRIGYFDQADTTGAGEFMGLIFDDFSATQLKVRTAVTNNLNAAPTSAALTLPTGVPLTFSLSYSANNLSGSYTRRDTNVTTNFGNFTEPAAAASVFNAFGIAQNNSSNGNGPLNVFADNFNYSAVTAVPEPTVAVLGLAGLLLGARRRR